MFAKYIYETVSAKYENKILLVDCDNIAERKDYTVFFKSNGFQVIHYVDDLDFRVNHSDAMVKNENKILVIAELGQYLPYDIIGRYNISELSYANLFPKLNPSVLKQDIYIDLDLLTQAYQSLFEKCLKEEQTRTFIETHVYGKTNVSKYLEYVKIELSRVAANASTYKDWFAVSEMKARALTLASEYGLPFDVEDVQVSFLGFVLDYFGQLATKIDLCSPVLVSRAMEYIHDRSSRYAIIVMDGMSQFDWEILAKGFKAFSYEKNNVFAMIPTTTSVSRQCLLSNKFPNQLQSPWTQNKEKTEFVDCAKAFGYTDQEICYERGYDAEFKSSVKCAAIIINDIDDMVHGQKQGRVGMYHDIDVLANSRKLQDLVRRILNKGLDVYITADHGNVLCTGTGKLMKTGVEVETKSKRMLVLKDFADKQSLIDKYNMIEYPKYYLDQSYDYLICNAGKSFDAKDEQVMTHGGITIDEVIVPFISIKAEENHG